MSDVAAIHNLVQKRNELKTRSYKSDYWSGCGGRSGVTLYFFSGGHALLVGVQESLTKT
jgi:MoxR-like ATPase